MFVEDEGLVHRFRLDQGEVRIGRDQSNDIWIDSPAVRPQTCLVYARDGGHHLKVYEGAKVLLNGQAVRGLNQLYSGDRIGVGDRELLYGRDDSLPQIAIGLTVLLDGVVQYGTVYRRNRVRLGRVDADMVFADASVSDRHMVIECYSEHGLFAFDLGSQTGTVVRGERVHERCRLFDGDVVQLGRVSLRIHLLPAEAYGILLAQALPDQPLVPLAAPKPMDRSPNQRFDPSAAGPQRRQADGRSTSGGFVRPMHSVNAAAQSGQPPLERRPPAPEPFAERPAPQGPPATEIGSLANLLRDARQQGAFGEPQHTTMADAVKARSDLEALAAAQRPKTEPAAPRESIRVRQAEEFEAATQPPPQTGFHEQRTEMLDTNRVYEGLSYGRERMADGAIPLTAVLDTELPPPLPPRTRAQREEEELKQPSAGGERYRISKATGGFDREDYGYANREPGRPTEQRAPEPQQRVAEPQPRRSEPPPPDQERYRLGRTSGSFDRQPVQDNRPRVAARPLTEAERIANPDWALQQHPAAQGETDASQRLRQQRTIDGSRRIDGDRDRDR